MLGEGHTIVSLSPRGKGLSITSGDKAAPQRSEIRFVQGAAPKQAHTQPPCGDHQGSQFDLTRCVGGQQADRRVPVQQRRQQVAMVDRDVAQIVQRVRAADLAEVDQPGVAVVRDEDVGRVEVTVSEVRRRCAASVAAR